MDGIGERMAAPSWAARRLFNVTDYHRMGAAGLFGETDRYELIEGEIIEMATIGTPHMGAVMALHRLLFIAAADRFAISVQNPLRLGTISEPEPDIVLLHPRADRYQRDPHPTPKDAGLVVEVAESSLDYDRQVKAPLYARYGVTEYWIVDLTTAAIEVYREPLGQGYRSVICYGVGNPVSPLCLPDARIEVADLMAI